MVDRREVPFHQTNNYCLFTESYLFAFSLLLMRLVQYSRTTTAKTTSLSVSFKRVHQLSLLFVLFLNFPPLVKLIQKLYQKGVRIFWIHNTGPIGCLPFLVVTYPPKPEDADQNGCIKSYNEVAQEFNKQLKKEISKLRDQLSGAALFHVDIYSAKYSLISEASKYGKYFIMSDFLPSFGLPFQNKVFWPLQVSLILSDTVAATWGILDLNVGRQK